MNQEFKNHIKDEEFVFISKRDLLDLFHTFNRVLLKCYRDLKFRENYESVYNNLLKLYNTSYRTRNSIKKMKVYK